MSDGLSNVVFTQERADALIAFRNALYAKRRECADRLDADEFTTETRSLFFIRIKHVSEENVEAAFPELFAGRWFLLWESFGDHIPKVVECRASELTDVCKMLRISLDVSLSPGQCKAVQLAEGVLSNQAAGKEGK